jgi:hypothetical protein
MDTWTSISGRTGRTHSRGSLAWAAVAAVAFCSSCADDGGTKRGAPVILTQPASQAVGLGQSALFAVGADSSGLNLTYRWFWNGWQVTYAHGNELAARPAVVADSGSTYWVEVSNAVGAVNSLPATLTVSPVPRAPDAADLRFQGVDATAARAAIYAQTDILSFMTVNYYGASGAPLQVGPGSSCAGVGNCAWFYTPFVLPPTAPRLNVRYATGWLGNLESALDGLSPPDGVVTSMDLEDAAEAYALERVQLVDGGGFDPARHSVAPTGLAAAIAQLGAAGRVVTAISSHSGQAYFLSYGWAGAPTTVYETALASAAVATPGVEAAALAAAGYVITALGSDGAAGVVLVGTRVAGDTMPRPLQIVVNDFEGPARLMSEGFAIVGNVLDPVTNTWTWIGEQ